MNANRDPRPKSPTIILSAASYAVPKSGSPPKKAIKPSLTRCELHRRPHPLRTTTYNASCIDYGVSAHINHSFTIPDGGMSRSTWRKFMPGDVIRLELLCSHKSRIKEFNRKVPLD